MAVETFLSTLSLRRATIFDGAGRCAVLHFYPRSPCGERRCAAIVLVKPRLYFYPRSPCGERPWNQAQARPQSCISIHALLAESDAHRLNGNSYDTYFYPRSPCGERPDRLQFIRYIIKFLSTLSLRRATYEQGLHSHNHPFLSTLSLRRATEYCTFSGLSIWNFYPRSPCGERPQAILVKVVLFPISIHALLAESDLHSHAEPLRMCHISIHALLAESDGSRVSQGDKFRHFYPRSPCGERHLPYNLMIHHAKFLSTLSLRRATSVNEVPYQREIFLSTLSLRRATSIGTLRTVKVRNFYPRSPCGERQKYVFLPTRFDYFYPRSPCGERPGKVREVEPGFVFLSTLSLRRATAKVHKTVGHFCAYETNFMGIASSC